MEYDVVIVGTGISGLYSALCLSADLKILLVTKASLKESNSNLAQGGISVLKNNEDIEKFLSDTLKAGHYFNNLDAVTTLVNSSRDEIENLINLGVSFDKVNNNFSYTKEGAHSINRILHHKDFTGAEIVSKLLDRVNEKKNITILEFTSIIDLIVRDNTCLGVTIERFNERELIFSKSTILATGGIGGLFKNTTSMLHLKGDSISFALKYNIALKDISYIQIHPTALYNKHNANRRFLISESLRGEGALLLNKFEERFVDELSTRDFVSKSIFAEMKKTNSNHVYLNATTLNKDFLIKRFPKIYEACLSENLDITRDLIPISPAQHYFMGGINVDLDCKTSMLNLFACGETACTGVHGKNRLASNSLLEAIVFSRRLANHLNKTIKNISLIKIPYETKNTLNHREIINLIQKEDNDFNDELFRF